MWCSFHPGWLLLILPLLMMLICALMCIFGRRMCGSGMSRCCGDIPDENRSQR